ncbi:MAG TPA: glycosyltransferase family 4 protein [Acetobacteraceae bacterium]|nr:glycosyltransferase family 4 protein [Acetobacteraceae bacterium]
MKVLVLSNMAPFVRGGAEELCDHLVRNLRLRRGVEAEAMRIPFTWEPAEGVVEEMLITRSLSIWNVDRLIPLKFPAYLAPHPNKVPWLLHQFRQAYDLFDAGQSNIEANPRGDELRSMIRAADDQAFRESQRIFTLSPTGADRLRRYNGFTAEILPQPLNDPELFPGGEAEGYILASGRVGLGKRQHLLIEAMKHASGLRLVIAGPPDRPEDAEHLRRLAAENEIEDRLFLDLRFLPRAELARLVNGATAVAYLPFDEDSVGYVTMEAFHAGKPVLSTSDAGGVLEIVRNGETGMVCEPTPEALGAAMSALVAEPARAARLGRAARALLDGRGITWPATVEKLLA